ncbi:MAG: hypothetical protein IPM80_09265 [Proteobacteria bacterium]|nr:hypothetical protein [Pseudomonadota bacterium]
MDILKHGAEVEVLAPSELREAVAASPDQPLLSINVRISKAQVLRLAPDIRWPWEFP